MKQIVICGEMEAERELLKTMLYRLFSQKGENIQIWEYQSGEDMFADAEDGRLKIDLLFLDIYMKGMLGIEAARRVREKGCRAAIVFLTVSPDFALESYEVQASGYLLKPFSEDKLREILRRIFRSDFKRRIVLKTRRQYRYPYIDDIKYIESDKHSIIVHLADGTQVEATEKLGDIEERINEERFLRCHQSYLVNMDYIADVKDDFILKSREIVPVRVRGRKKVVDDYYNYFINEEKKRIGGGSKLKARRVILGKFLSNLYMTAYYAF